MKTDVVVIGGGPGGSSVALNLLKAGAKVTIIEKESFPRYHIGESLTGECGACLRALGLEQQLMAGNHVVKWGVKVWGTGGKNSFWVPVAERTRENELKRGWTWQVRRSTFDKLLLDTAVGRGANLLSCEVAAPIAEVDRVAGVRYRTPAGQLEDIQADMVIDASGQATFLSNKGVTGPKQRGIYDRQVGIFSQLAGTIRDPGNAAGDTLIFYQQKNHWAWFIPIDDQVVSLGVVTPSTYFSQQKLSKAEFLKKELQTLNPELTRRLTNFDFVEEVRGISNYSYQITDFTGPGFICLGDAHRFIDPIFSFGLFFAIKEAQFASAAIIDHLGGRTSGAKNPFADYERFVESGQDIIQDLVDSFWKFPLAFQMIVHRSHPDSMIDVFAGRVFGDDPRQNKGVLAIRHLLASLKTGASQTC